MVLDPGETSAMHRHESDYLYVYVTPSEIGVETPHGPQKRALHEDGYVQYRDVGEGIEHQIRNLAESTHRQIIIEFKGPSRSTSLRQPESNGRSHEIVGRSSELESS
jgi:hypothetical protein